MILIYLSPVHWSSYEQRPHFMVHYFLDKGLVDKVVWIEPVPLRLPEPSDLRKRRDLYDQRGGRNNRVEILKPMILPLEPISGFNHVNDISYVGIIRKLKKITYGEEVVTAIGKPCRLALSIVRQFRDAGPIFYDAMDDFPQFYDSIAKKAVEAWEKELVTMVDKIVVSSSGLAAKFETMKGTPPLILRNACSLSVINASMNREKTRKGRSVAGYIGSMGKWFDWELVVEMAEQNHEREFHLVGPLFNAPPSDLPNNITLLPPCGHNKSVHYLSTFSVGLIPFLKNQLTFGVDPVKYYEYRAAGLPVISTNFGEMRLRGTEDRVFFVQKGDCKRGVADAIDISADITMDETARFVNENSWKKRFEPLEVFLRI